MTVTATHILVVGAAVIATGVLAAAWRRDPGAGLRGLVVMAAGVAIALAGVSRLASSSADPVAGQELALFAGLGVLALVGLATLARGRR